MGLWFWKFRWKLAGKFLALSIDIAPPGTSKETLIKHINAFSEEVIREIQNRDMIRGRDG